MIRMRIRATCAGLFALAFVLAVMAGAGCRGRHARQSDSKVPTAPSDSSSPSTPPDNAPRKAPVGGAFDTPEQTMNTYFEAARRKDRDLYRACFTPDTDGRAFAQRRFDNLSRRIQEGQISEVPMGVRMVGDSEAYVKISNNKKNRVREIKLRKVDGKWLIVPWKSAE